MKNKKRKYLLVVLSLILIISACGSNKKSMTVGDSTLSKAMLRYYLYNAQASYEVYYMAMDEELNWDSKDGDKTLEEKVKSTVLSDIKKKYELVNHISDFDVDAKVSDDEINDNIEEFKSERNKKLAAKIDISDKELKELFKNIILYNRINNKVRSQCEEKINEDEIRQCSIKMLEIKGEGSDIAAEDIFDRLSNGEDMEELADMNGLTITKGVFGAGDRNGDDLEKEILSLKEGEYGLTKMSDTYYIFYCDEYSNEAANAVAKEDKITEIADEVISEKINSYDDKVAINNKVLDSITFDKAIYDKNSDEIESLIEAFSEDNGIDELTIDDESDSEGSLNPIYTYLSKVTFDNEDELEDGNFTEFGDESLVCTAAVLIDTDENEIVFAKNADKELAPASTTKLMTALTVLEFLDADDTITVGDEIDYVAWDASRAYLEKGKDMTVKEAMTGMLICSGNDAAYALAANAGRAAIENEGGDGKSSSIDECLSKFKYYMNLNAKELGCEDVNFEVPDGYDTAGQIVTALDMARIGVAAKENETISSICNLTSYYSQSLAITWQSTNVFMDENSEFYYEYADGLKTGSTDDAGKCFIGSAESDGETVITVVLNSDYEGRWNDTKALMNLGLFREE